ncbi:Maleylacetoacetate isomerase / Glutathione S-transferase [Roseibacterium elongatum DSM 19469]|uniref:Maleylacetoacetate isomerase / Glutathione S-transferase n=1 Tax=Roseicyclus elongatus DSM 19469 TaxID=1294273 RepID=W8S6G5_9RHOB|nr:glutathione binding-like protein [Roseibacterium elongatum]AHM05867.1 Maleylacetoacetate isomerase / Glutathione S-transferase [Roseibacterium elongatum DSM 19469]
MTNMLYCFGESGNAYKAALALELASVPWAARFVDFFNGEARSLAFRAINRMGEVPVLDAHGTILTQSGVIQDWVMDETGKLCGDGSKATRREILRWTIFDNQKVSGQAGPLRFLMNFLPEDKRPQEVVAFMAGRLKAALLVLEAELATRDWLVGDSLTCADLSCCGYLYYDEPFTFDRAAYPAISAWLDRIAATPGWKHPYDLMQRAYPPA